MIKIFNTLTRTKEDFVPMHEGKVNMYVCGPTVYNYIHIGNARSAIAFDVIRRYLEYRGYNVNYVSNFTDVDDKIINRAKVEGITPQEVADKYIKAFKEDVAQLAVKEADLHPRVMETMDDIIAFIEILVEKGWAYEAAGDVYFRAKQFEGYGKLANKTIDELEIGASGRSGEEAMLKEDPIDFALWKSVKNGETFWQSPWGNGRPGWHIECSVMATKHLGDTIDIHGGGADLEFPHHTNEIAQSEAKTGVKFANYWMHNGFVTIGDSDDKMSKSLGNFVTVHDALKEIDGQVLRFLMSGTHYRRPIRFSDSAVEEATTNLAKLKNTHDNFVFRKKDLVKNLGNDVDKLVELSNLEAEFLLSMDDDFNAANGLTRIYELSTWMNTYSQEAHLSQKVYEKAFELFTDWLSIFGITFGEQELLDEEIDLLIAEREQARKERNFARADEIRDELKNKGIVLEDTQAGVRWKKIK
ncbi:MAG: cysteine--tRNA ligase [Streptococcaceae bacterium]|jgi:cysteinyl-tRNA synthetase|nr:cysteine--tRNA ligase [Streptococcaceae bacterium]